MRSKVTLGLAAVFWLAMNVLLWRAEFGKHSLLAGQMPAEVVWQKILTAQDSSLLDIRRRGKRIGFCRWSATIEETVSPMAPEHAGTGPEGIVKSPTGYRIELEGNAALSGLTDRLRFECHAKFATNHALQQFRLQLKLLSATCEIAANAADETIRLSFDDGTGVVTTRNFGRAQLRDPTLLAEQLAGGLSGAPVGLGAFLPGLDGARALAAEFDWRAQNDWLKIGQAAIRVHKLEIQLPGRRKAVVYISRVGEILRVELPGELTLTNQQLMPL